MLFVGDVGVGGVLLCFLCLSLEFAFLVLGCSQIMTMNCCNRLPRWSINSVSPRMPILIVCWSVSSNRRGKILNTFAKIQKGSTAESA